MKSIMTPNEYRSTLKNGLRGGWLFFGEEAYLKQYSLELTRKTLLGEDYSESVSFRKVNCLDFDIEKMTDAVATVSLFDMPSDGGVRLTEFHEINFGELKEAEWKSLEALLSSLDDNPDTVLIVTSTPEELDHGNLPKAPSKALSRLGEYLTPVYFCHEDDPKLIKWIGKHFSAAKIRTDAGACELLLERVGHDMYTLHNEISKLCAFLKCNGRDTLVSEDILNVTSSNIESDAFAFTNALMNRDCDRAYALLNEMRLKKEKAFIVLGAVSRVATELYTVNQLSAAGMPYQEIAKRLKMHEYKVKLCQRFAKERSERKLRSLIDECYKIDIRMKSTGLDDYTMLSRLVVLFAAR
ncbi:MAG: DNA polymerase III subunit delta [Clostridia bacterium]|nr:DNA polymerase III subunit delta [Clostridia bacterium]